MEPERRAKSGVDGGLKTASPLNPPLHLRTSIVIIRLAMIPLQQVFRCDLALICGDRSQPWTGARRSVASGVDSRI